MTPRISGIAQKLASHGLFQHQVWCYLGKPLNLYWRSHAKVTVCGAPLCKDNLIENTHAMALDYLVNLLIKCIYELVYFGGNDDPSFSTYLHSMIMI